MNLLTELRVLFFFLFYDETNNYHQVSRYMLISYIPLGKQRNADQAPEAEEPGGGFVRIHDIYIYIYIVGSRRGVLLSGGGRWHAGDPRNRERRHRRKRESRRWWRRRQKWNRRHVDRRRRRRLQRVRREDRRWRLKRIRRQQ